MFWFSFRIYLLRPRVLDPCSYGNHTSGHFELRKQIFFIEFAEMARQKMRIVSECMCIASTVCKLPLASILFYTGNTHNEELYASFFFYFEHQERAITKIFFFRSFRNEKNSFRIFSTENKNKQAQGLKPRNMNRAIIQQSNLYIVNFKVPVIKVHYEERFTIQRFSEFRYVFCQI